MLHCLVMLKLHLPAAASMSCAAGCVLHGLLGCWGVGKPAMSNVQLLTVRHWLTGSLLFSGVLPATAWAAVAAAGCVWADQLRLLIGWRHAVILQHAQHALPMTVRIAAW